MARYATTFYSRTNKASPFRWLDGHAKHTEHVRLQERSSEKKYPVSIRSDFVIHPRVELVVVHITHHATEPHKSVLWQRFWWSVIQGRDLRNQFESREQDTAEESKGQQEHALSLQRNRVRCIESTVDFTARNKLAPQTRDDKAVKYLI